MTNPKLTQLLFVDDFRCKAQLLAVKYKGDTADVTIDGTDLVLVDGTDTLTVSLIGKSCADVVGEIVKSDLAYDAWVLFDVDSILDYTPSISTEDLTTDGALIIRGEGHVFKNIEQSRLRVLPPHPVDRHFPWYVRIERGTLVKRISGGDWTFKVPEYDRQAWSPKYGAPYIDETGVLAARTGKNSFGLPKSPIYWDGHNIDITLKGATQSPTLIRYVDSNNGIVFINGNLDEDEPIEVDYSYEERCFIYRGIDLNPTEFHNPAILDRFVVFYLVPYSGPTGVVHTSCVRHSEAPSLMGALMSIPRTNEPFLILGAAQVRPVHGKDDIEVTDVRVRGGGIKTEVFDEASKRNKNALSTTDFGHYDGMPYPGSSTVVVRLDAELRDLFDTEQIKSAFRAHAAYGTYPILEFI